MAVAKAVHPSCPPIENHMPAGQHREGLARRVPGPKCEALLLARHWHTGSSALVNGWAPWAPWSLIFFVVAPDEEVRAMGSYYYTTCQPLDPSHRLKVRFKAPSLPPSPLFSLSCLSLPCFPPPRLYRFLTRIPSWILDHRIAAGRPSRTWRPRDCRAPPPTCLGATKLPKPVL
ncbi:hypothetical protein GQ53DRAFT_547598 [Thozetella sp. PMI_491]|nr:hypothetical protein GQ53DRAFT_547598 [Thozetella sp. PMI_491]